MDSKPAHRKALSVSLRKRTTKIQPLLSEISGYLEKPSSKVANLKTQKESSSLDKSSKSLKKRANTCFIELNQMREKTSDNSLRRGLSLSAKKIQTVKRQSDQKTRNPVMTLPRNKKGNRHNDHYKLIMKKVKEVEGDKIYTPPPIYQRFISYINEYTDCISKSKNSNEVKKMLRTKMWDKKANKQYQRESMELLKEMEVIKGKFRKNSIF